MLENVKKILIVKLRDIGDIVLSTPVLRILAQNFPEAEITYVLKKEYKDFKYLLPNVKQVIAYDKNNIFSFFSVVNKLHRESFDFAVNLHATYRSALITLFSGTKIRLVHNHSGKNYFTSYPIDIIEKPKNIIERDIDTLTPLKLNIPDNLKKTELLKVKEDFSEIAWNTIGLGIGAKRKVKIWNKDRFIELGRSLSRIGYNLAVFCSNLEKKDGEYITKGIGLQTKLYCGLAFRALGANISKLKLFIGNDSGLRHIAAAYNVKTITLFGPESINEWHPYKLEDGHIAIFHKLDCINCGLKECTKSVNCMDKISVNEVFNAVMDLNLNK